MFSNLLISKRLQALNGPILVPLPCSVIGISADSDTLHVMDVQTRQDFDHIGIEPLI